MKKIFRLSLVCILLLTLAGCSQKQEENTNTDNTSIEKINTEVNTLNTTQESNSMQSTLENTTVEEIKKGAHETEPVEEELASFTTKLGGKNSPRTRNIGITTSTLNGKTIESGQTFSFCNTVGVCTVEKGYEEADSLDHDGNKIQTLGGGNCQVSSTLYNAVLKIPELKVTERHPHSKQVHYVPVDKDAAVSYGSVDFKFKNNIGNAIKIYANSDLKTVTIRIVKLT